MASTRRCGAQATEVQARPDTEPRDDPWADEAEAYTLSLSRLAVSARARTTVLLLSLRMLLVPQPEE